MTEQERLGTLTKVCSTCKAPKPWTDFYPRRKWPDGTVRLVQSSCKVCSRIALEEIRKAKRKAKEPRLLKLEREYQRAYYRRKRKDPEYRARRAKANAEWRRRHGVVDGPYERRVSRLDRQQRDAPAPMLPIGPFSDWLEREIRLVGRDLPDDAGHGAATLIAIRGGVDPRRVHAWRRENKTIPLDSFDSFACEYGEPSLLADLYPDLDMEVLAA